MKNRVINKLMQLILENPGTPIKFIINGEIDDEEQQLIPTDCHIKYITEFHNIIIFNKDEFMNEVFEAHDWDEIANLSEAEQDVIIGDECSNYEWFNAIIVYFGEEE